MPITFTPRPAAVLLCDYTTAFVAPEMIKVRPVVVMSPRHQYPTGTILVVPFSTSTPRIVAPHHVRIPAGSYPFFVLGVDTWAKADMIGAVSLARLARFRLFGSQYDPAAISPDHFRAVQCAVLHALGLARLTSAI